jgi:hypothetical protein
MQQCDLCAMKHIGRARGLHLEALNGYPHNVWASLGELSLAEDHVQDKPPVCTMIREFRKRLETKVGAVVDWGGLIETVSKALGLDAAEAIL